MNSPSTSLADFILEVNNPAVDTDSNFLQIHQVASVCKAAGDPLRANILRVLASDSFGVLELCTIFKIAQPAMSHHLKCLVEANLVEKRREGTYLFYHRRVSQNSFLQNLFDALDSCSVGTEHAQAIKHIQLQRLQRSQEFFESNAGALHRQTELICDADVYTSTVLELASLLPNGHKKSGLEVGPGDGLLLSQLAAHFKQVSAVELSQQSLAVTSKSVAKLDNVVLKHGDFLTLPGRTKYNFIAAAMVIHHLSHPQEFFKQASKLSKAGTVLVVCELCKHNQAWVRDACGDVWLGFEATQLNKWAKQYSFTHKHQQYLAQRNGFTVQVHCYHYDPK